MEESIPTFLCSDNPTTPAWWGFVGEGDRLRLERLIARMRRRGYLPSDFPNIASLAEEADRRLSKSIIQCQTLFYVIYLLTSPPLRAPSVLGRILSSCPIKTIETL